MKEMVIRLFSNLTGRVGGPAIPAILRLILLPLLVGVIGVRAGLKDGHERQAPYFWSLINNQGARKDLLSHGWSDIVRVFVVAIMMDMFYQTIVLNSFYPLEALIAALVVTFFPYVVVRSLANQISRPRKSTD